jgi:hypothetical protein
MTGKDRLVNTQMSGKADRSYLGVAACLLFAIALSAMLAVDFANRGAEYKMAGLEGIVVFPFSLLLYFVGLVFGLSGLKDRQRNPGTIAGVCLNSLALAACAALTLYSIVH